MPKIAAAQRIGLLIRDDALTVFAQEWQHHWQNKTVFHCSGSFLHPEISALHPLMTFGEDLYELKKYQSILFVGDQGRKSKEELLPEVPNPFHALPAEQRPLYHALCVSSGNLTTLLWSRALKDFEQLGIPKSPVLLYLQTITDNFCRDPEKALTGPFARRDLATLRSNLRSLSASPLQGIYTAFLKWFPDLERQTHERS